MQTENLNLKRSLVFQSFAPLFLLLAIKHLDMNYLNLICKFVDVFRKTGINAVAIAINHALFGEFVVLTDNVTSVRELIVFITMLIMVIMLLTRSNTFYQNPVLAAMKYRTFSFK